MLRHGFWGLMAIGGVTGLAAGLLTGATGAFVCVPQQQRCQDVSGLTQLYRNPHCKLDLQKPSEHCILCKDYPAYLLLLHMCVTGIGGPPMMMMYAYLDVSKNAVRGTNAVMSLVQVCSEHWLGVTWGWWVGVLMCRYQGSLAGYPAQS